MNKYRVRRVLKGEKIIPAGHTGNYRSEDWVAQKDCYQILWLDERGGAYDQNTRETLEEIRELIDEEAGQELYGKERWI